MTDLRITLIWDPAKAEALPPLDVAREPIVGACLAVLRGEAGISALVGTLVQVLDFREAQVALPRGDFEAGMALEIDEASCWTVLRRMLAAALPGWWFRVGQCYLSTDIALGPDFNDPAHGERLRRAFPEDFWDGGLDFDIRPPVSDAAGLAFGLLAALQRIADIQDAVKQGSLTWPE